MTIDLEAVRKLEEQLRADDKAMTPAGTDWKRDTGVYSAPDGDDEDDVAFARGPMVKRMRGEKWAGPWMQQAERNSDGIARTRNALPVLADTLRDLRVEVERLWLEGEDILTGTKRKIAERDAALERIENLHGDVSKVRDLYEATARERDAALAEVGRLRSDLSEATENRNLCEKDNVSLACQLNVLKECDTVRAELATALARVKELEAARSEVERVTALRIADFLDIDAKSKSDDAHGHSDRLRLAASDIRLGAWRLPTAQPSNGPKP